MDARPQHHLFDGNMNMFSESNGAAAAFEAMGVGSSSNAYHGPSLSDAMHGATTNVPGEGGPIKRKRGRPRKYMPSNMAVAANPSVSVKPSSGRVLPAVNAAAKVPVDAAKRAWVRSPSSSKKQQMEALGQGGAQFKAHVISIAAGEEVSSKIMAFTQQAPNAICILAASGAISNATVRQAASSGGTVTYEGPFQILSLSGSFLLLEDGGQRSRAGGLSVLLACPDGRVLGGGVAGPLIAATRVEVVVGSFNAEGKKEQEDIDRIEPASALGMLAAPLESLGQAALLGGEL